jgi:hypothetical protein
MAYAIGESSEEVRRYVDERMMWIGDALEVVGRPRDANPLEVFPEAGIVRAESPELPGVSPGQEAELRTVAERFGIGIAGDVESQAETQLNDGGLAWKVHAETVITKGARRIVFSGTPARTINDAERIHIGEVMGQSLPPAMTEFDMVAKHIATALPGYIPLDKPEVRPFGYTIDNGEVTFVEAPTGQYSKIGSSRDAEVFAFRVDRGDYINENGEPKWKQPDATDQIRFIGHVLTATGVDTTSIGFNSSNTYPSRAIDVVRAAIQVGVVCLPGMYGRKTLAEVRHLPVGKAPEINQITGEFHVIYKKLVLLANELDKRAQQ